MEQKSEKSQIPKVKKNRYLLESSGCPGCAALEIELSEEIKLGDIIPINMEKDDIPNEVMAAIGTMGVQGIPDIVSVEERDGIDSVLICMESTEECKEFKKEEIEAFSED